MIRTAWLFALLLILLPQGKAGDVRDNAPGVAERFLRLPGAPSGPALRAALAAYERAMESGSVSNSRFLTVIDYTLPSRMARLWVLDLDLEQIVRRELVAHGKHSGEAIATAFSNRDGSLMSSLGLFITDHTYIGTHGYSLRLRGLDPGINDHAYERAIVIHGASYVSETVAKTGQLGRSWGCPAVSLNTAKALIDIIKDGSVLFAFGPRG